MTTPADAEMADYGTDFSDDVDPNVTRESGIGSPVFPVLGGISPFPVPDSQLAGNRESGNGPFPDSAGTGNRGPGGGTPARGICDANHASGLDEALPGLWTTEDRDKSTIGWLRFESVRTRKESCFASFH
jgi:hypothetical protein